MGYSSAGLVCHHWKVSTFIPVAPPFSFWYEGLPLLRYAESVPFELPGIRAGFFVTTQNNQPFVFLHEQLIAIHKKLLNTITDFMVCLNLSVVDISHSINCTVVYMIYHLTNALCEGRVRIRSTVPKTQFVLYYGSHTEPKGNAIYIVVASTRFHNPNRTSPTLAAFMIWPCLYTLGVLPPLPKEPPAPSITK